MNCTNLCIFLLSQQSWQVTKQQCLAMLFWGIGWDLPLKAAQCTLECGATSDGPAVEGRQFSDIKRSPQRCAGEVQKGKAQKAHDVGFKSMCAAVDLSQVPRKSFFRRG